MSNRIRKKISGIIATILCVANGLAGFNVPVVLASETENIESGNIKVEGKDTTTTSGVLGIEDGKELLIDPEEMNEMSLMSLRGVEENNIFEVEVSGGNLEDKLIEMTAEMGFEPINIKRLKITGTLNDEDKNYLKKMTMLEYIDIQDTDIKLISVGMISLNSLTEIVLPSKLEEIEKDALPNGITVYDVPSTLYKVWNTTFYGCTIIGDMGQERELEVSIDDSNRNIYYLQNVQINGNFMPNVPDAYMPELVDGNIIIEENVKEVYGDMSSTQDIEIRSEHLVSSGLRQLSVYAKRVILDTGATVYRNKLMLCDEGKLEELDIKDRLERIDSEAFDLSADNVKINGVKEIGYRAFKGNYGGMNLGDTLEVAGVQAIGYVDSRVEIPSTIQQIDAEAFRYIKETEINSETTHTNLKRVCVSAFNNNATGKIVETNSLYVDRDDFIDPDAKIEWSISKTEVVLEVEKTAGVNLKDAIDAEVAEQVLQGHTNIKSIKVTGSALEDEDFKSIQGYRTIDISELPMESLPVGAFKGNKTLEEIKLPSVLKTISKDAFNGCSVLSNEIVLNEVTSIGENAFNECEKLREVSTPKVSTIGDRAFQKSGIKNIVIPSTITSIGVCAFNECVNTERLEFEGTEGLSSIGERAFAYLGKNKETLDINVPDVDTDVWGDRVFYYANVRGTIKASKYPTLQEDVFYGSKISVVADSMSDDIEVVVDEGTSLNDAITEKLGAEWKNSIHSSIKVVCKDLGRIDSTELELLKQFKKIDLTDALLQDDIIPSGAFKNMGWLEEFKLPTQLSEIQAEAFYGCTKLSGDVIIEADYCTIGYRAFCNAERLDRIIIRGRRAMIGDYAFSGCTNLKGTVDLYKVEIGAGAFSNTQVIITGNVNEDSTIVIVKDGVAEDVRSAYNRAMELSNNEEIRRIKVECTNNEYLLAEDVEEIFKIALELGNIKEIDLSESQIGDKKGVIDTQKKTIQVMPSSVFNLEKLILPKDAKVINNSAMGFSCKYDTFVIKELVMPENLEEIKQYAFNGYVKIELVRMPDTLKKMESCFVGLSTYDYRDSRAYRGKCYLKTKDLILDNFNSQFTLVSTDGEDLVTDTKYLSKLCLEGCNLIINISDKNKEIGWSIDTDKDVIINNTIGKNAKVGGEIKATGDIYFNGEFKFAEGSSDYTMKLSSVEKTVHFSDSVTINKKSLNFLYINEPFELEVDNEVLDENMVGISNFKEGSTLMTFKATYCKQLNNMPLKEGVLEGFEINKDIEHFNGVVQCNATELDFSEMTKLNGDNNSITIKNCKNLETVKLPNSACKFTFNSNDYNCNKLKDIYLNGCNEIGRGTSVRGEADGHETVNLHGDINQLKRIEEYGLSGVHLDNTDVYVVENQEIDNYAFYNSEGLNKITLKGDLDNVGYYVFATSSSVKEVELKDVVQLPKGIFSGCQLAKIDLGDKLKVINSRAIEMDSIGNSEIMLPATVTDIQDNAIIGNSHDIKVVGDVLRITNMSPDYVSIVSDATHMKIPVIHMEGCEKAVNNLVYRGSGNSNVEYYLNQQQYTKLNNAYAKYFTIPFVCVEQDGSLEDKETVLDLTGLELTKANIVSKINEKLELGETFELTTEVFKVISDKDITANAISAMVQAGIRKLDLTECSFENNKVPDNTLKTDRNYVSIKFPSTIKEIGDNAFYYGSYGTVDFGGNVEKINRYAITGSTFNKIELGNNLREIGQGSVCKVVSGHVSEIGLDNIQKIEKKYNKLSIANDDYVHNGLFENTNVKLNGTVTYNENICLGNSAICGGNLKVVIPSDTTVIGDGALFNFKGEIEWTPGSERISVGDYGLAYLDELNLDLTGIKLGNLGRKAFSKSDVKGIVEIGTNANGSNIQLGAWAFEGTGIEQCTIYSDVISGYQTFKDCMELKKLVRYGNESPGVQGSSVEEIEFYNIYNISGMEGCKNLKNFTLVNDDKSRVTYINSDAFKDSNISESTIHGFSDVNVTSIGDSAFENCTDMKNLSWLNWSKVTEVGANAFKNSGLDNTNILAIAGKTVYKDAFSGTGVVISDAVDTGTAITITSATGYEEPEISFATVNDERRFKEGDFDVIRLNATCDSREINRVERLMRLNGISAEGKALEFTYPNSELIMVQEENDEYSFKKMSINCTPETNVSTIKVTLRDTTKVECKVQLPKVSNVVFNLYGDKDYTEPINEICRVLADSGVKAKVEINQNDTSTFDISGIEKGGIGELYININGNRGEYRLENIEYEGTGKLYLNAANRNKITGKMHVLNALTNIGVSNVNINKPEELTIEFDDMSKIQYSNLEGCYIKDLSGLGLQRDNFGIGNIIMHNVRFSDYRLIYMNKNALSVGTKESNKKDGINTKNSITVDNSKIISNDDIVINSFYGTELELNIPSDRTGPTYGVGNKNFYNTYVDKLVINAEGDLVLNSSTMLPYARVLEINAKGNITIEQSFHYTNGDKRLEELYVNSESGGILIKKNSMQEYNSLRKIGKLKNATIEEDAFSYSNDHRYGDDPRPTMEFPELENVVIEKNALNHKRFIGELKIPEGCKVDISNFDESEGYLIIEGEVEGKTTGIFLNEELNLPSKVTAIQVVDRDKCHVPNLKRLTINADNFEFSGNSPNSYTATYNKVDGVYSEIEEIEFRGQTLNVGYFTDLYLEKLICTRDDAVVQGHLGFSKISMLPGSHLYSHWQDTKKDTVANRQLPMIGTEDEIRLEKGETLKFSNFTIDGMKATEYYRKATDVSATPDSQILRYVIRKDGQKINKPIEQLPEGVYDIEVYWTPYIFNNSYGSYTASLRDFDLNKYVKSNNVVDINEGRLNVSKLIIGDSANKVKVVAKTEGSGRIIGGTIQYGIKGKAMMIKFEGIDGAYPKYYTLNGVNKALSKTDKSITITPTADSEVIVAFENATMKKAGVNTLMTNEYKNSEDAKVVQELKELSYLQTYGYYTTVPVSDALRLDGAMKLDGVSISDISSIPDNSSVELVTEYKIKTSSKAQEFRGRNITLQNELQVVDGNSEIALFGLEEDRPIELNSEDVTSDNLQKISREKNAEELKVYGVDLKEQISLYKIMDEEPIVLGLEKNGTMVSDLSNVGPGEYNIVSTQVARISPLTDLEVENLYGIPLLGDYTSADNYTDVRKINRIPIKILGEVGKVSVSITKIGNGTVSPAGNMSIDKGESVSVAYSPDTGNVLDEIIVDGSVVTHDQLVSKLTNIQEDKNVVIKFKAKKCSLNVSSNAGGEVDPKGDIVVDYGDKKTIKISPDEGYKISQVKVNGVKDTAVLETSSETMYTTSEIRDNTTIEVEFKKVYNKVNIVEGAGGTVSPKGDILVGYGDRAEIVNTPLPGYKLDKIKVNGVEVPGVQSTSEVSTFVSDPIKQPSIIEVSFKVTSNIVKIVEGDGGTVTPNGEVEVVYGDKVSIVNKPKEGYVLDAIIVNGVEAKDVPHVSAEFDYTSDEIKEPTTIEVKFAKTSNKVTISSTEGGKVDPEGELEVPYGDTIRIEAVPDEGYELDKIDINNSTVPGIPHSKDSEMYITDPIKEPTEIEVAFRKQKRKVTVRCSEGGSTDTTGVTEVDYGSDFEVKVTSNKGYKIGFITINGVKVTGSELIKISNIKEDTDVYVQFERISVPDKSTEPVSPSSPEPTPLKNEEDEPKRTRIKITFKIGDNHWYINDIKQDYVMDRTPEIKDGRSYIPIRFLSYALKTTPEYVIWDYTKRTANIKDGGNVITLKENDTLAYLNFEELEMDGSAYVVEGRTMLPISQILGVYSHRNPEVRWDEEEKKVDIFLDVIEDLNPKEVDKEWYIEYAEELEQVKRQEKE